MFVPPRKNVGTSCSEMSESEGLSGWVVSSAFLSFAEPAIVPLSSVFLKNSRHKKISLNSRRRSLVFRLNLDAGEVTLRLVPPQSVLERDDAVFDFTRTEDS